MRDTDNQQWCAFRAHQFADFTNCFASLLLIMEVYFHPFLSNCCSSAGASARLHGLVAGRAFEHLTQRRPASHQAHSDVVPAGLGNARPLAELKTAKPSDQKREACGECHGLRLREPLPLRDGNDVRVLGRRSGMCVCAVHDRVDELGGCRCVQSLVERVLGKLGAALQRANESAGFGIGFQMHCDRGGGIGIQCAIRVCDEHVVRWPVLVRGPAHGVLIFAFTRRACA